MRLIGSAFVALVIYLSVQSTVVLVARFHPHHSTLGIIWTGITAVAMFLLTAGKSRTGTALNNPVLRTEGHVTFVDGVLATAVFLGLVLNAALDWWWADPAARDTSLSITALVRPTRRCRTQPQETQNDRLTREPKPKTHRNRALHPAAHRVTVLIDRSN